MGNTPAFRGVYNGLVSVDSFFVMGGLLLSYLTFKELDKAKGWINLPMVYIHRYIRFSSYKVLTVNV